MPLPSWLTVWARGVELLPLKLLSPPYWAMIEWDPAIRVDVVKLAVPPLSVAVPRVDAPS